MEGGDKLEEFSRCDRWTVFLVKQSETEQLVQIFCIGHFHFPAPLPLSPLPLPPHLLHSSEDGLHQGLRRLELLPDAPRPVVQVGGSDEGQQKLYVVPPYPVFVGCGDGGGCLGSLVPCAARHHQAL